MNSRVILIMMVFFLFACDKEEVPNVFSTDIHFEVSKFISTTNHPLYIELTPNGFYYYSYGINRIFYSTFAGDTTSFKTESEVLSLVFDQRFQRLYFGTRSNCLGVYDGRNINYFTPGNSILPRKHVKYMDVDNEGNLWICSSNNGSGGLYRFNGKEFIHFSTENSPLHHDLIRGICCQNSAIYIVAGGTSATHKAFKIERESGENYKWNEIISEGYFNDICVDINENVYLLSNDIIILSNDGTKKTITPETEGVEYIYTQFKTDKRGYMWVTKFPRIGSGGFISVYDGEKWHQAPADITENGPNWIDVDDDNNIWIATYSGIYILEQ
jgi:ligand-binding sensor domain-containing protein